MDYLKFYDLERAPFQNDPDERFYFESAIHRRARALLLRGAQHKKALGVLVGDAGCGKTTLARLLFDQLEKDDGFLCKMLVITHADCARGWLLPEVARSFGVKKPAEDAPGQLAQIERALHHQCEAGKHPVLIVDEAQLLSNAEVMEEFRGILNLTHDGSRPISILLFGLPELADLLALDAPLAQRVEIRADVRGLPAEELESYLKHRLEKAGSSSEVFSAEALTAIWAFSAGVPRVSNTLADAALFEGALVQQNPVDASLVSLAAEQLQLEPETAGPEIVSVADMAQQMAPAAEPASAPSLDPQDMSVQAFEEAPELELTDEASQGELELDLSGPETDDELEPDSEPESEPKLGDSIQAAGATLVDGPEEDDDEPLSQPQLDFDTEPQAEPEAPAKTAADVEQSLDSVEVELETFADEPEPATSSTESALIDALGGAPEEEAEEEDSSVDLADLLGGDAEPDTQDPVLGAMEDSHTGDLDVSEVVPESEQEHDDTPVPKGSGVQAAIDTPVEPPDDAFNDSSAGEELDALFDSIQVEQG